MNSNNSLSADIAEIRSLLAQSAECIRKTKTQVGRNLHLLVTKPPADEFNKTVDFTGDLVMSE